MITAMLASLKELGWVLVEEILFGLHLTDITTRRTRHEPRLWKD